MNIVLVEFGENQGEEAEAFINVGEARDYFVDDLMHVTNRQFDIALKIGSYYDSCHERYIAIHKNYTVIGSEKLESSNLITEQELEERNTRDKAIGTAFQEV